MICPNSKCKADNPQGALFCHVCGSKLKDVSMIDNDILDIIEQNSYSKRILAAYEGRKYANQICKKHFGKAKKNYKEYVEMLMAINYPKELEKANLGKKYSIWLYISIGLSLTLYGVVFSLLILFLILMPIRKQLKELCK